MGLSCAIIVRITSYNVCYTKLLRDFSKNYFELFGLPVGYIVDAKALAERYRELQRIVHPDRFANASDQERRLSVQGAALINEAYETLKDPIARSTPAQKPRGPASTTSRSGTALTPDRSVVSYNFV